MSLPLGPCRSNRAPVCRSNLIAISSLGSTLSTTFRIRLSPFASVTRSVNGARPTTRGVPRRTIRETERRRPSEFGETDAFAESRRPAAFSSKPTGSFPLRISQLRGAARCRVLNAARYGSPTTAGGRDSVNNSPDATVITKRWELVAADASRASIVKAPGVPGAVGVP